VASRRPATANSSRATAIASSRSIHGPVLLTRALRARRAAA
jgi:hypothetical protein